MNLLPLPAFSDNYIWLLHNGKQALVVDPGDAAGQGQAQDDGADPGAGDGADDGAVARDPQEDDGTAPDGGAQGG